MMLVVSWTPSRLSFMHNHIWSFFKSVSLRPLGLVIKIFGARDHRTKCLFNSTAQNLAPSCFRGRGWSRQQHASTTAWSYALAGAKPEGPGVEATTTTQRLLEGRGRWNGVCARARANAPTLSGSLSLSLHFSYTHIRFSTFSKISKDPQFDTFEVGKLLGKRALRFRQEPQKHV